MALAPYRAVLAAPGVRSIVALVLLIRVPVTAAGIALTLHVVLDLGLGHGAAGLATAAYTVGSAVGSAVGAPLLGRLADRRGLRAMIVVCTVGAAVFWGIAPLLGFSALLGACVLGGLTSMPPFSVGRQALAALVPEPQRRAAYALDSISGELSFLIGPAGTAVLVTTIGGRGALFVLGAILVGAGIALYINDSPARAAHEETDAAVAGRSTWLTAPLIAVLLTSAGAAVVFVGYDVAVIAASGSTARSTGSAGSTPQAVWRRSSAAWCTGWCTAGCPRIC